MSALSKTYAKTKTKRPESNWRLHGEGCHLHVLQRRAFYSYQDNDQSKDDIISKKIASFEDAFSKKIAANDDKIKSMETKLDELLKAFTATIKQ